MAEFVSVDPNVEVSGQSMASSWVWRGASNRLTPSRLSGMGREAVASTARKAAPIMCAGSPAYRRSYWKTSRNTPESQDHFDPGEAAARLA